MLDVCRGGRNASRQPPGGQGACDTGACPAARLISNQQCPTDLEAELLSQPTALPCRRKYEVYVCTAATQDYAFEAWRVLDTGCTLIPFELLQQRITCVKTHRERKKLSAVLRSKDAIRLPEGGGAGIRRHCLCCLQHSLQEDVELLRGGTVQ